MLPVGWLARFSNAALRARNARDPKKIAVAMKDVPETIIKSAAHHGVVWRLDAHPVDCVEDSKLILASLGVRFLDIASNTSNEQRLRLKIQLQKMFGHTEGELDEQIVFVRWLANQLGGSGSKTYWLAKRLDETTGTNGFLDLLALLKEVIGDHWSAEQISELGDVKRIFRIG